MTTNRKLLICDTCRYPDGTKTDAEGRTGGQRLIRHLHDRLAEQGHTDVVVEGHSCLWACKRRCTAAVQDGGRYSFLLGDFSPDDASAEALIDYFDLHGDTQDGLVPFADWPAGVKGHFIARLPVLPSPEEDEERKTP